jgi:hypothetical protein
MPFHNRYRKLRNFRVGDDPLGNGKSNRSAFPVNLTYFVLMPARALTTACGFCQVSSNTVAYSPDSGG